MAPHNETFAVNRPANWILFYDKEVQVLQSEARIITKKGSFPLLQNGARALQSGASILMEYEAIGITKCINFIKKRERCYKWGQTLLKNRTPSRYYKVV